MCRSSRRDLDQHIPKGYIYFAMFFSVFVEMITCEFAHARRRSTCTSRMTMIGTDSIIVGRPLGPPGAARLSSPYSCVDLTMVDESIERAHSVITVASHS